MDIFCLPCTHFHHAPGLPAPRQSNPRLYVAGDFEYFVVLVDENRVNGKAHKAHMDAVAGRDEQAVACGEALAQHKTPEAGEEGIGHFDL